MKTTILKISGIFVVIVSTVLISSYAVKHFSLPYSDIAGLSALIVAMSAVSQIIFGIIIYIESSVLDKRVHDGNERIFALYKKQLEDTDFLREALWRSALEGITAIRIGLYDRDDSSLDKTALRRLDLAEIKISLVRGSYSSLWNAMQKLFKLGADYFFSHEQEILIQIENLPPVERKKMLGIFQKCKSNLLVSKGIHLHVS